MAELGIGFDTDLFRVARAAVLGRLKGRFALKPLTRPPRDGRLIGVGTLGVPSKSSTPPEGPNIGLDQTAEIARAFNHGPVFDAPQAVELHYGTPRVPTLIGQPSRAGRVKGFRAKRPLRRPSTAARAHRTRRMSAYPAATPKAAAHG